jgi:hypothetical protein
MAWESKPLHGREGGVPQAERLKAMADRIAGAQGDTDRDCYEWMRDQLLKHGTPNAVEKARATAQRADRRKG